MYFKKVAVKEAAYIHFSIHNYSTSLSTDLWKNL